MKTLTDLQEIFSDLRLQSFRLRQIVKNACHNLIPDYQLFTDLPKELRDALAERAPLLSVKPLHTQMSARGDTIKTLFETADGKKIEAVLMRFKDGRNSLCISCQSGCQMGCKFCATGTMGLLKHLTYEEIFDQALYFSQLLHKEGKGLSNIVFMGMGEPFMNYDCVMQAANLLSDPDYLALGARRITISTSGVVPGILRLADEPKQYNLAISLHSPDQATRERIMPIARRWPISELMDAIQIYLRKTGRRISYEYVMLKGVNDSVQQAQMLGKLVQGQLCHVNLIPYNPTGSAFEPTDAASIQKFRDILENCGLNVTIRVTMGQDIAAACGQLAQKR